MPLNFALGALLFVLPALLNADGRDHELLERAKRCPTVFGALQILQNSPGNNPILAPLTPEMRNMLHAHSLWAKYHSPNGGDNLRFYIAVGPRSLTLGEGDIYPAFRGESIQGHFLVNTLKELFPQAAFYSGDGKSREKQISIRIRDSYDEHLSDSKIWRAYNTIEMKGLKEANGRTIGNSKEEIRELLGIPKEKTVVSIYGKTTRYLRETVEKLVLSPGNPKGVAAENLILFHADSPANRGYVFSDVYKHLFSDLGVKAFTFLDFKPEGGFNPKQSLCEARPCVIENREAGLMPYLLKAADLHIITGPVNLFEGLNAGTPTIFFNSESIGRDGKPAIGDYELRPYREMADLALASGGAVKIDSPAEIPEALHKLRTPHTITPPYLIPIRGKTPFQRYLDTLEQILDGEMKPMGTASRGIRGG